MTDIWFLVFCVVYLIRSSYSDENSFKGVKEPGSSYSDKNSFKGFKETAVPEPSVNSSTWLFIYLYTFKVIFYINLLN